MTRTGKLGIGFQLLIACGLLALASQFAPLFMPAVSAPPAEAPAPLAARPALQAAAAPQSLLSLASSVDQTAERGFAVVSPLRVPRPLAHGEYVWDDSGVPAGRISIVIDLQGEEMHVFRAGYEIGRTVILYGADHLPTPTGTFPISQKDIDHISNLYDAPMPYMLRLTNDGVAIHGSQVDYGYATHGCIGVPDEFAALLFEQARLGDTVVVQRGSPYPVDTAEVVPQGI